MLESLKKAINRSSRSADKKVKPNSDAKSLSNGAGGSFGGLTHAQLKKRLDSANSSQTTLVSAQIGEEARNALESYKEKEPAIKVATSSSISEVIATIYSEGSAQEAVNRLKSHLNENQGLVDKRFWYMLMDTYQVQGNRQEFERTALIFANRFGASPPSWHHSDGEDRRNVMAGKNIIILEPAFKMEHTERFKEFFKAAKEEKFCRINVSQCKFEQSEMDALQELYKLFVMLRKAKVMSVLMGDNNLISFCKNYINPNTSNKTLKAHFIEEEEFFWLLYLEVLQWKGKMEEFENLAFEYAQKFEICPPGWETNGVMLFEKNIVEEGSTSQPPLDKVLNSNNIQSLLSLIQKDFEESSKSEIELANVERIDFASAGDISHFIQELWAQEAHQNKQVIFKHPNEMILTLLEMVGVTEFVKIVPKTR